MRDKISKAETVVIKFGTKILVDKNGQINEERIASFVKDCDELKFQGKRLVLVSSGAVGAGMKVLGTTKRPTDLADLQLAAAVGQAQMGALYERLFSEQDFHVGQILLTHDNLNVPTQRDNAVGTMKNML